MFLWQSWVFTGGTDAEAETPIFWTPDARTNSYPKGNESLIFIGRTVAEAELLILWLPVAKN